MTPDLRWQRAMISELGLDWLLTSAHIRLLGLGARPDIQPSTAEIDRAAASILAWRSYLPAPCVAAMIKDGWQWST